MKKAAAIRHLNSLSDAIVSRYARYMDHIRPTTPAEVFQRWLFTYASVHTTWMLNCKLYWMLRDLSWLSSKSELKQRIIDSRAGFQNKRTDYIWEFAQFYWQHSGWFTKASSETWAEYRKRLMDAAPGIGFAKSSFVIELTHPLFADTICVDTHVLQLYGYTPRQIGINNIPEREKVAVEGHWTKECRKRNIPPVLARWAYWDGKQGQPDSRYWSFVLERMNYQYGLAQVAGIGESEAVVRGHGDTAEARSDSSVLAVS